MLLDELETDPPLAVAQLERLHQRARGGRHYTRTVAEAVASGAPALERAGGWLLRRAASDPAGLPAEDWAVVLDGLDGVRSWAGRLLLCQLLAERPELADTAPAEVAGFLRDCAVYPKSTVRAWSVTALHELARRHPAFRPEARRAVAAARRDPAKCMQARLRHLDD
jgi:hypothetical protein